VYQKRCGAAKVTRPLEETLAATLFDDIQLTVFIVVLAGVTVAVS